MGDALNDASCSDSTNNGTRGEPIVQKLELMEMLHLLQMAQLWFMCLLMNLVLLMTAIYLQKCGRSVWYCYCTMANVSNTVTGDNIRPDVAYDGNHNTMLHVVRTMMIGILILLMQLQEEPH